MTDFLNKDILVANGATTAFGGVLYPWMRVLAGGGQSEFSSVRMRGPIYDKNGVEIEGGDVGGGVTKIIAGYNTTISPISGIGEVTISEKTYSAIQILVNNNGSNTPPNGIVVGNYVYSFQYGGGAFLDGNKIKILGLTNTVFRFDVLITFNGLVTGLYEVSLFKNNSQILGSIVVKTTIGEYAQSMSFSYLDVLDTEDERYDVRINCLTGVNDASVFTMIFSAQQIRQG